MSQEEREGTDSSVTSHLFFGLVLFLLAETQYLAPDFCGRNNPLDPAFPYASPRACFGPLSLLHILVYQ